MESSNIQKGEQQFKVFNNCFFTFFHCFLTFFLKIGGIPAFDANSKTDLMLLATETGLVLIDGSYNPTTVACVPLSDCFQSNSDVGVHFFKWSEAIAMIMNKKGDISMFV